MIPQFPNFTKVSLDNRAAIEEYTHKHQPYSDFNFASLWSWDATDERMVSVLNDNLIVKFTDYSTNEPLFSFLGKNLVNETAKTLISYAKEIGVTPKLGLIPKESADEINCSALEVVEDKDNFDYLFSISDLAYLQGSKYKSKRRLSKGFERNFQECNIDFKVTNSKDKFFVSEVEKVIRKWEINKQAEEKDYELENEEFAIKKLLSASEYKEILLSLLFVNKEIVGFSIDELLPNKFVMSHFFKADKSFKGAFEFLNERVSEHLLAKGHSYWNWEQDLGIESLHRSKVSYRPIGFIKKYTVREAVMI